MRVAVAEQVVVVVVVVVLVILIIDHTVGVLAVLCGHPLDRVFPGSKAFPVSDGQLKRAVQLL